MISGRRKGRKEKLTRRRVHRPKNSLRSDASPRQYDQILVFNDRNFLPRLFLAETHLDEITKNLAYESRAVDMYAVTLLKFFSFFVFSANETVKPIVSRHHLHHHRVVLGRAWLRQWDHFRLSYLLHAFQLHRRPNVQNGRVRRANYRIRFKGIGWVFVGRKIEQVKFKFFRRPFLLSSLYRGARLRNETNNPDNVRFENCRSG